MRNVSSSLAVLLSLGRILRTCLSQSVIGCLKKVISNIFAASFLLPRQYITPCAYIKRWLIEKSSFLWRRHGDEICKQLKLKIDYNYFKLLLSVFALANYQVIVVALFSVAIAAPTMNKETVAIVSLDNEVNIDGSDIHE